MKVKDKIRFDLCIRPKIINQVSIRYEFTGNRYDFVGISILGIHNKKDQRSKKEDKIILDLYKFPVKPIGEYENEIIDIYQTKRM